MNATLALYPAIRFHRDELDSDDRGELFKWVRQCFYAGQRQGDWPVDRDPPSGGESIVWAEDGGGRVGFATFYPVGHGRVWLDLLYVAPRWRRRGIGRQLIEDVAAAAGADGETKLMLGTSQANLPMRMLAVAAGFQTESTTYARPLPPERTR